MQVDHRKGPRRRGEILEEAIMRAALDELAEVGYPGVSMERIAARARTSKAALYRRWPDRAHLIVDSYLKFVVTDIDIPDTGSLRNDVLALMRRLVEMMTPPVMEMFFGLLSEAGTNRELVRDIQEQLALLKPRLMGDVLERAAARGELRSPPTPRQIALPIDLLRNEIVRYGHPVRDESLVEIVDEIFLPLVSR